MQRVYRVKRPRERFVKAMFQIISLDEKYSRTLRPKGTMVIYLLTNFQRDVENFLNLSRNHWGSLSHVFTDGAT